MTTGDLSIIAFAVLNGARIFAYVPQIVCVSRDRNGASGVSLLTWGLFTLANLATAVHALLTTGDNLVAGIFLLNTISCLTIFVVAAGKRLAGTRLKPTPVLGHSGR